MVVDNRTQRKIEEDYQKMFVWELTKIEKDIEYYMAIFQQASQQQKSKEITIETAKNDLYSANCMVERLNSKKYYLLYRYFIKANPDIIVKLTKYIKKYENSWKDLETYNMYENEDI
jgi:hypothetical protein